MRGGQENKSQTGMTAQGSSEMDAMDGTADLESVIGTPAFEAKLRWSVGMCWDSIRNWWNHLGVLNHNYLNIDPSFGIVSKNMTDLMGPWLASFLTIPNVSLTNWELATLGVPDNEMVIPHQRLTI